MNGLIISYHLLKAQLLNTYANFKSLFKSKPKLNETVCYTSEVNVSNYYLLNLLKEIKVIDFKTKEIKSYSDILEILNEYADIKTIFVSTFIQNTIINVAKKYPNHIIYIEDFNPDKLLIKVHLVDINVFKEIFVINDQAHKESFDAILKHDDCIGFKIMKSSDNQGYKLIEQRFIDNNIKYDQVVQLTTSFKSIQDIIGNHNELNLYYLNETFTNKIKNELPNINNQIIDVLLSSKPIDDFIILNKIL